MVIKGKAERTNNTYRRGLDYCFSNLVFFSSSKEL